MVPLIQMTYHGDVEIDYWEYLLSLLYILFFYLYFARKKNRMLAQAPEYKYYIWGLMAKLMGGLFFSLIYFYYYRGGDTTAYFYSGVAMRNLALYDPLEYLNQMFGDNSMEAWSKYTLETAKPYQYVYLDDRTFAVVRLASVLALVTFKSYLISTLMIASLSYFGVWACYRTFVSYFPQSAGKLSIGFLFMPSSIFWGSAILKDTFTFSAVCWWVHAVDEIYYKKRNPFTNWTIIVISGFVLVIVKPYIFMVMFPATLLWLLYFRISRLQNVMVKLVLVPLAGLLLVALSLFVLTRLGDAFDKFALDEALETIQVTQVDLSNADSYGTNSFELGTFDGTWSSVLSKFPIAVNAALFRPYIWESGSVVMALSGMENLWVLGLAVFALLRSGPFFILRCIGGVPLLLMATVFSVLFAFTVGVTTPNFGALVRFKIPMVPFFISTLYIIIYLGELKRRVENSGKRFNISDFSMGSRHVEDEMKRRKRVRRGITQGAANGQGPVQMA